jgi:hypothetical protein
MSRRIGRKGDKSVEGAGEPRVLVLACAVVEAEVRRHVDGRAQCLFFDYGLHRTPENMAKALQAEIDRVSEADVDGIVLGYGLCSNGIVGVCSARHRLIIPRIHDCISLFLGSPAAYHEQSTAHPGTYYLTPGWIDKGETPLSKFQSYAASYGEETARWILHEEMKHYTRIALIDTGAYPDLDPYREVARRNAEFLGLLYEELRGEPEYFKKLAAGPWEPGFLILQKGVAVQQEMFFDL